MSDDPPRARRYDEAEVSLILQKAAEMQMRTHERADGTAGARGMSLAELESIAAEAGLSPEHVRRAATQLATPPRRSLSQALLGAPVRVSVEREVEGELPASALEQVANVLRRHAGSARPGQLSVVGRTLMWTLDKAADSVSVSVSPHRGRTIIQVDHRLVDFATGTFVASGTGGVLASGAGVALLADAAAMSPPLALAITAVGVGASYLLGRGIVRWKARTTDHELHELAEVVAECVREAIDAGE